MRPFLMQDDIPSESPAPYPTFAHPITPSLPMAFQHPPATSYSTTQLNGPIWHTRQRFRSLRWVSSFPSLSFLTLSPYHYLLSYITLLRPSTPFYNLLHPNAPKRAHLACKTTYLVSYQSCIPTIAYPVTPSCPMAFQHPSAPSCNVLHPIAPFWLERWCIRSPRWVAVKVGHFIQSLRRRYSTTL